MKKILSAILSLVLVLSLFSAASAEEGKYGVAVPNATNSFYATCIAGVEEGVKAYDCASSVIVTDASFDSGKQLDQVNDLISQGCKAIILIPVDSNSILPAIDECKKANIPVFVMDTPAGEHDGVISTVTANNYSAGEIAGGALVKAMGGEGKIVTITTTGSEAVNQRKQALYDQLKDYPGIEIVQEEIVQKGTTEEAQTIMENLIQSVPDLKGVFTTGDVFAIGICAALQANGFAPGDVKVTSIDGTKNALELIKSGYLTATAAQLPAELGKTCVKNAVDYLAGKTVEENVQLLCSEINADNYTEFSGF
ncbi:MAG: sugar ABC transporter substrate-binding protein [Christensenellaceae bacterium]|nr:sugar ABC transporter substrate-binding protein [Christensenellaceae bacterium]MEA5065875.1 sugar ABC transporter substrate-binding protein [Eubacteriales bacterium]MEA5068483.1 sugar ABC transporter substrate-binding protein [Christensenellaceae bacterium]